jgi:hypothetical protein
VSSRKTVEKPDWSSCPLIYPFPRFSIPSILPSSPAIKLNQRVKAREGPRSAKYQRATGNLPAFAVANTQKPELLSLAMACSL